MQIRWSKEVSFINFTAIHGIFIYKRAERVNWNWNRWQKCVCKYKRKGKHTERERETKEKHMKLLKNCQKAKKWKRQRHSRISGSVSTECMQFKKTNISGSCCVAADVVVCCLFRFFASSSVHALTIDEHTLDRLWQLAYGGSTCVRHLVYPLGIANRLIQWKTRKKVAQTYLFFVFLFDFISKNTTPRWNLERNLNKQEMRSNRFC